MNFGTKIAGVSPFANLRRSAATIKAAEDEKDEKDDEKSKKSKAAEDEKDEKDDEKSKKSKAEDEKKDDDKKDDESKKSKAEDEKKDDDKKDDEKSKKSKRADGDDDSDREDEDEPDARAARARERGRIQAICEAGLEVGNPDAAYHLAVGSSMSRQNAIAMLRSIGPAKAAASRDALRERMSTVKQPDIGAGGEETAAASDPKGLAARIVAARRKADGEAT